MVFLCHEEHSPAEMDFRLKLVQLRDTYRRWKLLSSLDSSAEEAQQAKDILTRLEAQVKTHDRFQVLDTKDRARAIDPQRDPFDRLEISNSLGMPEKLGRILFGLQSAYAHSAPMIYFSYNDDWKRDGELATRLEMLSLSVKQAGSALSHANKLMAEVQPSILEWAKSVKDLPQPWTD